MSRPCIRVPKMMMTIDTSNAVLQYLFTLLLMFFVRQRMHAQALLCTDVKVTLVEDEPSTDSRCALAQHSHAHNITNTTNTADSAELAYKYR